MKDGRQIQLEKGELLVLVGPNNSGKTHFLKQLVSLTHGIPIAEVNPSEGLISTIETAWSSTDAAAREEILARVERSFKRTPYGFFQYSGPHSYPDGSINEEKVRELDLHNGPLGALSDLFMEFDNAIERISETDVQQLQPETMPGRCSLTQLARDSEQRSQLIAHYFERIFHQTISFYDRGNGLLGYLLAPALTHASTSGNALSDPTKAHMDSSPKMWLQGLGMRSVLGLLLKIFAGGKDIILIDEPEAFLHPPQASSLGAALVEISLEHNKQFIIATHDRNLLIGITKEDTSSVNIQKLSREPDSVGHEAINSRTLSNVRERSLIRYSPILDSLFSKLTILVENEKDAFFYSECISHLLRKESAAYPGLSVEDILFLSTSGKNALARTAELLTSLHAKVVVACDHDLIADPCVALSLFKKVNNREADAELQQLLDRWSSTVLGGETDQSQREKAYRKNKEKFLPPGSNFFDLSNSIISSFAEGSIHLNPLGELEDFQPELVGKRRKSDWAHKAILSDVHKSPDAVAFARRLLSSISPTTTHA